MLLHERACGTRLKVASPLILVGNFCGTLTRQLVWGALQLVLIVGAKLQYIIIDLAIEVRGGLKKIDLDHLDDGLKKADHPGEGVEVQSMKPRDDLFWFSRPKILIKLIHFILFQNAFELAFFFWALFTYGFNSCLMG